MKLVTIDGLCVADNLSLAQWRKISRKDKSIIIGVTHVLLPDFSPIEPSIPSKNELDTRRENFEKQRITPSIHIPPKTTPPTAQHKKPTKPFLGENGEILPVLQEHSESKLPPRILPTDIAKNIARAEYLKTLPRSPHRIETESPRKNLKHQLIQPNPESERKNYAKLRSQWESAPTISPLEPKTQPAYNPYLGITED